MTQETQILAMIGDMKGELGEFRGQLRELVHNMNNVSSKIDSLATITARNHDLPDEIISLKARLAVLEAKEHQRTGAVNLGSLILKSPLVGWIAAAGAAAYAWFKN